MASGARAAGVCWALLAAPAFADGVEAWIQRSLQRQRPAPTERAVERPSAGLPWLVRGAGKLAVPGFTPPGSLAPLVRAVRAGVVGITTRNGGSGRSVGTGFVVSADGLIVTNHHVVEKAQDVAVRLADGTQLDAALVGSDGATDLALLRLEKPPKLAAVSLGDSDALEVGDWVMAIGSPFGLEASVTHGLISAKERAIGVGPFDDFLQTNALINPGNSGGPLFDMRGDVVGVASAVMSQGQGIGFAVPINLVKDLLPNLLDDGRADRGWLGINVRAEGEGAEAALLITEVFDGSPARAAGLAVGDRIVSVNGRPAESYRQALRRIALLGPGAAVKLALTRRGKAVQAQATLVERPAEGSLRAWTDGTRLDALGLSARDVEVGGLRAVRIAAVVPGGAAEAAGLAVGDLLVEVERVALATVAELNAALARAEKGGALLLKVRRGESARYVTLLVPR